MNTFFQIILLIAIPTLVTYNLFMWHRRIKPLADRLEKLNVIKWHQKALIVYANLKLIYRVAIGNTIGVLIWWLLMSLL